jgi:N-acetylmuramoyl-L-alanine amidase
VIIISCVYLSPSTQQFNEYVNGGNEEYYMNLIADRLAFYLDEAGICYYRNDPLMDVNAVVIDSNLKSPVLHFAIHSNAAPESLSGRLMGTDVYYFPSSVQGRLLAEIVADNFKSIYPYPDKVKTRTATNLAELRRTTAPSVLVEVAYHDNEEDANWIKNNIDEIARNFADSIIEYLNAEGELGDGIPAQVVTMGSRLNMRAAPSIVSPIVRKIPNGSTVTVLERNGNWYKVIYGGQQGYVSKRYLAFL